MPESMTIHRGSCHCGAVRFEIDAPAVIDALECNCSICEMTGYLHLIVARGRFRMLSGEESLQVYRFNTGVARHSFCRICGIKPFYAPRSHPEGYSVNVRCLESSSIESLRVRQFNGRQWEQNISELSPISD